jgi:hypothetical protein
MNPWQQQPGPNWGPPPPGPPQQPYPQPGYPVPFHRPAGSGTAVTAIVLSSLIALFQGLAFIGYLALGSELSDEGNAVREWVPGFLYFEGLARLLSRRCSWSV